MGDGHVVEIGEVRGVPKEVRKELDALMRAGWTLREQGHKYRLYCPCGDTLGQFRVDGTVDGGTLLARIRRNVSKCPDAHQLMK